jgi:CheY-like chemotaxis protein
MPNIQTTVLIVDDEAAVRTSLSSVLTKIGFKVRTAEDGNSAIVALRDEVPEILISDLNMPGMSGFELLREVRTRFPHLNTIAMSGAFAGNEAPSGVAADAFYQKGSSVGSLLKLMEDLPWRERIPVRERVYVMHAAAPASVSRQVEPQSLESCADQEADALVCCPKCLRPLSQTLNEAALQKGEAFCPQCGGLIQAVECPSHGETDFLLPHQRQSRMTSALQSGPSLDC